MKLSYIWKSTLLFCITIINLCIKSQSIREYTAPWIVSIQKYDLSNLNSASVHHCTGVLTENDAVLTSAKCLETFPDNAHMILYAGATGNNLERSFSQKFLPFGRYFLQTSQIKTFIAPPIERTQYVDFIATCFEQNCRFDTMYGYQIGWNINVTTDLQMFQYNFSNSSELCSDVNELPKYKFCTYHICTKALNNFGGEILTKVHKGQSYLMGFWDYDACDKNIRVFAKLKQLMI